MVELEPNHRKQVYAGSDRRTAAEIAARHEVLRLDTLARAARKQKVLSVFVSSW